MPYRLTKIYTRSGDKGYTSLGDKKVSKDDLLIEAMGTIDELNSHIGFILSLQTKNKDIDAYLTQIQNELFDMGGELYFPQKMVISADKITNLEIKLDEWNEKLPPLQEFVLPRGNPPAAATHIARTVCRRAERVLVSLHRQTPLQNEEMLRYLNRLSDLLFVIARTLGQESQAEEKLWEHK